MILKVTQSKEFPLSMKRLIALFVSLLFLVSLSACMPQSSTTETDAFSVPTDDASYVYQAAADATPLPGGSVIALVADSSGLESGAEAMLWKGIQTFAANFGYTAQSYTYDAGSVEAAQSALGEAAQSGAALVVCRGEEMARALFQVQSNYPGVQYLLFDGEPHNEDYTVYTTESAVHCVIFQEEQAGYLAGYASVTEGYTTLGFVGNDEVPDVVRYCTGFLQGAEKAAEQQGEEVTLKVWFTGDIQDTDLLTSRLIDWYNDGTGVILANGGNLVQCAVDAANQTGGRVFATDWDQNALGERVLGSAIKCYNGAVQRQLYTFFSANGTWSQEAAGKTEKVGYTDGSVALAGSTWRFSHFTQQEYENLYDQLRNSDLKVEAYADMDTLPDTPSVALEVQN